MQLPYLCFFSPYATLHAGVPFGPICVPSFGFCKHAKIPSICLWKTNEISINRHRFGTNGYKLWQFLSYFWKPLKLEFFAYNLSKEERWL
jgi:hypothetical protein